MSKQIEVRVGSRAYKLSVEEGQERRLQEVVDYFNSMMGQLSNAQVDRDNLLVLSGIMMADEYFTYKDKAEAEKQDMESFQAQMAEKIEALVKSLEEQSASK